MKYINMKKYLIVSLILMNLLWVDFFAQHTDISLKSQIGDLGNGYYLNPILAGDYADPTIVRDGSDYYMTHSSFDYLPGLKVLHSKDLVNWEPISHALKTYLGSVWAPDITKHGDKFYIYFTVAGKKGGNYVVWANSPYGPWSDPINLGVKHIDPGYAEGENGSKWLFVSGGHRIRLTEDGLTAVGELEKVYDGWEYPSDWVTTCFCLEGPKVRYINGYYYYVNAQGGTLGAPTAHMAVLARSRSINGPWENSPHNPLVHTANSSERWWNKGHASLIDTPDGKWYMIYHSYENGYLNLGRQTLLEPLEWTNDGWLRIPEKTTPEKPIKKPIVSKSQPGLLDRLGEFRIGYEWRFFKDYDPSRVSVKDREITIQGKGKNAQESAPLLFIGGLHGYEIEVEIELEPKAIAGFVLWYNEQYMVGMGVDTKNRYSYRRSGPNRSGSHVETNRIWLRIRNDNHVVSGTYSFDGDSWKRDTWGMEVGGYNNNTLGDFMSLLPGIFVSGEGKATFKNLRFREL